MLCVRAAEPGDEMAVAGVHVRSWRAGYRGLLSDVYLDQLRPEDRAGHYVFGEISDDAPQTIVGVQDGTICGFASTGLKRGQAPTVGELLALYVDPACWRAGVGRRLIEVARWQLSQRGCSEAILWVLVDNERAVRFYRTDGWAPDGVRRTDEVWGLAVDELRWRRALP
jgi:ribosomal protein S18 acetylase RimI-like enzyme